MDRTKGTRIHKVSKIRSQMSLSPWFNPSGIVPFLKKEFETIHFLP